MSSFLKRSVIGLVIAGAVIGVTVVSFNVNSENVKGSVSDPSTCYPTTEKNFEYCCTGNPLQIPETLKDQCCEIAAYNYLSTPPYCSPSGLDSSIAASSKSSVSSSAAASSKPAATAKRFECCMRPNSNPGYYYCMDKGANLDKPGCIDNLAPTIQSYDTQAECKAAALTNACKPFNNGQSQ